MDQQAIKEYYQRIGDLNIEPIARELLGHRITGMQNDHVLLVDCPHHASDTHKSMHVNIAKQKWFCFGCGIGGDVLHLVEFVQSGTVTKGKNGNMPESHRRARDFLADKCGLPPLSSYGLPTETLEGLEADHFKNGRALDCLTESIRWYHERLKENEEVYAWFRDHYRLSDKIISSQHIGWAYNKGMLTHLHSEGFTDEEIASTGLFYYDTQDQLVARFRDRIMLPYWTAGARVDYVIGRQTPWTSTTPAEQAKYKKLPVHDEHNNKHIAKAINNSHLHNEHILLSQNDYVVFTEGITDNLSAIDNGIPAISPVTVSVRNADWPRIIPKLARVKRAYVVGDNEVSKAGLEGSLKIATALRKAKIDARIIILPLSHAQKQARNAIAERWGITDLDDKQATSGKKKSLSAGERVEYDALCQQAKCDLNAWFADGHTRAEFDALMEDALVPVDLAISRLDGASPTLTTDLTPILREACQAPVLEQKRIAKAIKNQIGKDADLSLADIQAQITEEKQSLKAGRTKTTSKKRYEISAAPGTCRHVIESKLKEMSVDTDNKDALYSAAGEAAFAWFVDNGAKFFRTTGGDPFVLWANKIYWMHSIDSGKKSLYGSMIYDFTGLTASSTAGRVFLEVMKHMAVKHGQIRDKFSWLHTDIEKYTIWFNLANDQHEIAKISPDGVTIVPNGGNEDGIFLVESEKMLPITFVPDVDEQTALGLLRSLFMEHLACARDDQMLIFLWMSCFLLLDFSATKPMARFEGPSGSGKSTAAKFISILILGEEHQKRSTVAANFADSERTPIVLLDNVEVQQMTDDLLGFFLTAITGITNEKRSQGTDSGIVQERPKCLICSTGIAPLAGEFSEITSRSIVVNFDPQTQSPDFIEGEAKAKLRAHRDYLLSWIMVKTSKVLAALQQDAQRKIKKLLAERFPGHAQRRCNEFLALMYAFAHVTTNDDEFTVPDWLEKLTNDFVFVVEKMGELSKEVSRDSNPIIAGLSTLFDVYRRATAGDFSDGATNEFEDRYLLRFSSNGQLVDIPIGDLHRALANIAYAFRLPWPYKTSRQFSQRLKNDVKTIEEGGFKVTWRTGGGRQTYFSIEQRDHEGANDAIS